VRRSAIALFALLALLSVAPAAACADTEGWHPEQPVAAGIGLQESLGEVGDLAFWSPNRGVLITPGVGGMPAGVYAYDGVEWHLYSTVCGGHRGSVAWEGPDSFWTVSDQPVGQEESGSVEGRRNRSLCHFQGGRVVASYAEPLGTATSYLHLNAAACRPGTAECWFGGERLPGSINVGAFHLRWNGSSLTSFPPLTESQSLEDPSREVADLDFAGGSLYESVTVDTADGTVVGEPNEVEPAWFHLIDTASSSPFRQLFATPPLDFGGTVGTELGPFHFADAGEGLYAVAGAHEGTQATVTLASVVGEQVQQIPLLPNEAFLPGDRVEAAAAEPGTGVIWVAYHHATEATEPPPTRVVAVHTDGTVGTPIALTGPGGGNKGFSQAVACPAAGQCWAVSRGGWLFHLGGPWPRDEDPAMHALINFRPADNSTPSIPPFELPEDDSGAEKEMATPPAEILEPLPRRQKQKKLISKVKQSVIHGHVLQLSFTLFTRAHVRLIAERHGKVVAETKPLTLGRGHHQIRLSLDPKKWPTHLNFKVHPAAGKGKKK
jgi:hypothetical protein